MTFDGCSTRAKIGSPSVAFRFSSFATWRALSPSSHSSLLVFQRGQPGDPSWSEVKM